MASKRNVIKATKSPMGCATCYTTNMTRCVIRPTYKGGGSYLPRLQGEHGLWMRQCVIEIHRGGEERRREVREIKKKQERDLWKLTSGRGERTPDVIYMLHAENRTAANTPDI